MRASIITPTFNAIDHIEACIRNVRDQGDAVLEHIIADGGSSDGTIETIRALAEADPKIRLIPGPDKGQADALNKASAAATGEVIGILNCDDSYEPGAVREALRILRKAAVPTFLAGNCRIYHPDGLIANRPGDLRIEALLLDWDYAQFPANPAAYFYHREVQGIVGGYDVADHYTMDLDFILKCAGRVRMRHVDRHWGNFHLHPGCKTFDDRERDVRRHDLFRRYIALLTSRQQRRMQRIRRRQDIVRSARAILKRSALLRAINRLVERRRGLAVR